MGNNTLQIKTYISLDGGSTWTNIFNHISKPLVTTGILSQTWQFTMWVNKTYSTSTDATIKIGDTSTANSIVSGIGLVIPSDNEIQSYRMFSGDWIGFLIHGYDIAGVGLYPLVLLIPTGCLYLRHTKTSVILVFFVLFGGAGIGLWSFIPGIASLVVYSILALILAFMFWRLIKS
jgi:hypothetical protein